MLKRRTEGYSVRSLEIPEDGGEASPDGVSERSGPLWNRSEERGVLHRCVEILFSGAFPDREFMKTVFFQTPVEHQTDATCHGPRQPIGTTYTPSSLTYDSFVSVRTILNVGLGSFASSRADSSFRRFLASSSISPSATRPILFVNLVILIGFELLDSGTTLASH